MGNLCCIFAYEMGPYGKFAALVTPDERPGFDAARAHADKIIGGFLSPVAKEFRFRDAYMSVLEQLEKKELELEARHRATLSQVQRNCLSPLTAKGRRQWRPQYMCLDCHCFRCTCGLS